MNSPLRVLLLEDNSTDAELALLTLAAEKIICDPLRVETRTDFIAALEQGSFDLILSDNALPSFDGLSALEIAREKCPDTPFIFVSGTIGEERAIETLKGGATDYVLKQRLSRLAPSVRRAISEFDERTARKKLERQLVESQKMEAVGRLAAGIAHDFNNVLTVISGYTGLLLARVPAQDPMRREISEISEATQRAAALTKRLLAFGRKDLHQPTVLDLNAVISDLDHMLRRVIGDEIRLVTQLSADLGWISVDKVQMEQVLINLIINARDAMAPGGEITVMTENVHEPNSARNGAVLEDGIMLSVADTGHGMDEATKARIFEPFFTTKEVGKGTGLGLWSVREIVQQSRGDIRVESQVARGTTFKIFFPCAHQEREVAPESCAISTTSTGTETILVVENEATRREMVQKVLAPAGYRTLLASDGAEALRIVELGDDDIHLLVTDVAMPDIRGTDLADRITARRPDLRVLYLSGCSDGLPSANGSSKLNWAYLRKPFTGDALLQSIREVLDMPRQASIVVADDDAGIRKLLCDVLRTSGYHVLEAANGKQAIDHICQEHVDLLLTDLVMPEQEGIETIGQVRRRFPSLRVLAMSGGFGEHYLHMAQKIGAHQIIRKPFETHTIREAIRGLLALKG